MFTIPRFLRDLLGFPLLVLLLGPAACGSEKGDGPTSQGAAAVNTAPPSAPTWNVQAAQAAGTACESGIDTFISASGDDVSVLFDNLGVNLQAWEGEPTTNTAQTGACEVILPGSHAGYYPSLITESLTYDESATSGASAKLESNITQFLDWTTAIPGINVSTTGGDSGSFHTQSHSYGFPPPPQGQPWIDHFCGPVAPPGNPTLTIELEVSGTRAPTVSDAVTLNADSFDLHVTWQPCP